MQEIPSMFIYNCICVMSDQLTSKAGTITSDEDRFMEWKTKDGNMESKVFAGYHQYFAVRKAKRGMSSPRREFS